MCLSCEKDSGYSETMGSFIQDRSIICTSLSLLTHSFALASGEPRYQLLLATVRQPCPTSPTTRQLGSGTPLIEETSQHTHF